MNFWFLTVDQVKPIQRPINKTLIDMSTAVHSCFLGPLQSLFTNAVIFFDRWTESFLPTAKITSVPCPQGRAYTLIKPAQRSEAWKSWDELNLCLHTSCPGEDLIIYVRLTRFATFWILDPLPPRNTTPSIFISITSDSSLLSAGAHWVPNWIRNPPTTDVCMHILKCRS